MAISGVTNSILIFSIFGIYLVLADLEKIDPDLTRVVLVYGTKYEMNNAYTLDEADKILKDPKFIHNKTTLFIPDLYETQISDFHPIAEGYGKLNKINFLQIDLGVKAGNKSEIKRPDVETLVPLIADFIMQLLKHVKLEDFHFVAYSSGVEVAFNVSQCIIGKTDGKIKLPRLTLLDPPKSIEKIKMGLKSCADFIDAIHTNGAHFGTDISVGHADFWPNGGMIQPGCTTEINECSRRRAGEFYAESVANRDSGPQFYSYCSTSYLDFLWRFPYRLGEGTLMGINCDTNANGNYYLFTYGEPPYAMDWIEQ